MSVWLFLQRVEPVTTRRPEWTLSILRPWTRANVSTLALATPLDSRPLDTYGLGVRPVGSEGRMWKPSFAICQELARFHEERLLFRPKLGRLRRCSNPTKGGSTMARLWAVWTIVAAILLAGPVIESGTSESTQIFQAIGTADGGAW